jgi:O-antigen/teichoic acid export membrane protein
MRERRKCDDYSFAALKRRAHQFAHRPFLRNVAAITSGTVVSQAIGLVFAPIVTRLFGPQAYGIQSVFTTVAGVMASAAALSYPIAIVLPRRDAEAIGLARLSMYVGIGVSLLTGVALYFVGDRVLALLDASEIKEYDYLIPVFMVSSVAGAVVSQWLIRKQEFVLTAKVSVLATVVTGVIKTGIGVVGPSAISLIGANMLGGLLATTLMAWIARRRYASGRHADRAIIRDEPTELLVLARQHSDFPLYRTPQNLLNALSAGLPVALLAGYFGSAAAGYYAVASTVLVIPAGLIGASVMQVFYPRVTQAIQRGENTRALVRKATLGLALAGVLPFAVICLTGPALFGFVFGVQWHKAGIYAQWLSPWLFLQYINKPAVAAIPALGLQGRLLIYELFSTGSKVLALYLGFVTFGSDVLAIALFSVFGVVAYVWLILWVMAMCGTGGSTMPKEMH